MMSAAKASGLLPRMEKLDTHFALKLAHLLFSTVEQFLVNVQAKDITIQAAVNGSHLRTTYLKSLRNEAKFDLVYNNFP